MFKKALPHLVAIGVFALLTIAFFLPYYQDMSLTQGDIVQFNAMSKETKDWNEQHPSDPALWTGRVFAGMPTAQISQAYPTNFVSKVIRVFQVVFPEATVSIFWMMLGFYILLLCLDVPPWLSLVGALAYAFSSFIYTSLEAGHNTKVVAMSLMAPIIGGVILAYRKNILLGAAIAALSFAISIDANHLQITYYTLILLGLLGIYFLAESVLKKEVGRFAKASGVLAIAFVIGFLPNTVNLWNTFDYAKETIRGGQSPLTQKQANSDGGLDYDYATRWSYGSLIYRTYNVIEKANPQNIKSFNPGQKKEAYKLIDSLNKTQPGAFDLKVDKSLDAEFLSVLIPDMKGGGSGNALSDDNALVQKFAQGGYPIEQVKKYMASVLYWGHQPFTSGPVYFGAAVCFLFIFSLLAMKSQIKWAFAIMVLVSFLLAFGHNTPFFGVVFSFMPFFNKFRNPSMALAMAELIVPLMALLGISEIIADKQLDTEKLVKKLMISAGITAGIIIVFGVLGGMWFNFSAAGDANMAKNNPEIATLLSEERQSMLRADSIRSLFFIAVAFGLVWAFLKKKLESSMLIAGLALVFLVDGWSVAKRYLSGEDFVEKQNYQANYNPTQADMEILKDPDPNYRVFNYTRDPFNDAMTSYYHKSVGGYHPAKLIRYQDLIENQISRNNQHVLDMLNTKYVIGQNQQTGQEMSQQRPTACGNAWFVSQVKWVANADQEMAALTDFEPHTTAVIDNSFKNIIPEGSISYDSTAGIKETLYSPNKMEYFSKSSTPQLAVFSEIYYNHEKGWHAFIDGKPVEHARANYVLRAMMIPAGEHKIEFVFEPRALKMGGMISLIGSILLFASVFGYFGFLIYKKTKEEEPAMSPAPASKVEAKQTPKKK
jgi:MFS family permease